MPLSVTNPDGGSSNNFPIPVHPTLTSTSPSSIPAGKAATVTLSGAGFSASSYVTLNGSKLSTSYDAALRHRLSSQRGEGGIGAVWRARHAHGGRPLRADEAVPIALQIAEALEYAHERGEKTD